VSGPANAPNAPSRARAAFDRGAWEEALETLIAADRDSALEPDDLERGGIAAWLVGRDHEGVDFLTRAHQSFAELGDVPRAARSAFWLGFQLMHSAEPARANGWFTRARSMLEESGAECVECGFVLLPPGIAAVGRGDYAQAIELFDRAYRIGVQFRNVDLTTNARQCRGRALLRLGRIEEGVAHLDEAMVAITAGEVSPQFAGEIYCSVIEGCTEIFDLRRAQEWTTALAEWCSAHPDLVPFRGQCLVRRAEILQVHGDWPDALEEARRAEEWLSRPPPQRAVGSALYREAELHRLRGEFEEAERAYRDASDWGRSVYPGFAEMRLAQGQVEAAKTALDRALHETREIRVRAPILAVHVEAALAARDLEAARRSADELLASLETMRSPMLVGAAYRALGGVLLAEGDAAGAADALRFAADAYREIDAPYDLARVRELRGAACRQLGDADSGALELEAARRTYEQLGAAPDLDRLRAMEDRRPHGRLTDREIEVLRLVAKGKTNRAIAGELHISEKTVARHLSNIFTKLDLSSRSAATAYGYEHGLV
jgi:DNA-binding NarL/FixJ family response regulator